jgi:hypothetical protein
MNHQGGQGSVPGSQSPWSGNLVALVARRSLLRNDLCHYMNSSVSCSHPGPTWSPLVYPLALGTLSPLQRSSFLWLSIVMRMTPSHWQPLRRPSSTRSNVSTTGPGGVRHLNRINLANSWRKALEHYYSLCSLSRPSLPPPPPSPSRCATGLDLQFC